MHLHAMAILIKKKYFLNLSQKKIFFKQMAIARSIFTLDGWVQLFWAAFDMPMTGVPLKVLGISKPPHLK